MPLKPATHQPIHVGATVQRVIDPDDIVEIQRDDGLVIYARADSVASGPPVVVEGTIIGFEGRYAGIQPQNYPIADLGKRVTVSEQEVWAVFHKA